MTAEEHKARHVALHASLDELLADWIAHASPLATPLPSRTTVLELIMWSAEQANNPTHEP